MEPTRPEQGKFNKSQKAFLDAHLPTYFAINDKKKGVKKSWILLTVFPLYVKEFNSDAPDGVNLASLEVVHHFPYILALKRMTNIISRKCHVIFSIQNHLKLSNP